MFIMSHVWKANGVCLSTMFHKHQSVFFPINATILIILEKQKIIDYLIQNIQYMSIKCHHTVYTSHPHPNAN